MMPHLRLASVLLVSSLLAAPACVSRNPSGADGSRGGVCQPAATEACYAGPPGTEGVGVCRAGSLTCAEDGSGFGACEGEVLPGETEGCTGAADLDCDGHLAGCLGADQWVLPVAGDLVPAAVAASTDGEATVVGWARALDIGLGAQGDGETWSLAVARVGADGAPRWLRLFPGVDAADRSARVAMNEAHEAFVVVRVEGQVTLDGAAVDAADGGVLALRLTDGGALATAGLIDLAGPPGALAVSPRVARLDGDGLLVGGAGFLARLDAGLQTAWHHRYEGDVTFSDLARGPDGAAFATGTYRGEFEPGGGAEPVLGNHAAFVAALAGEGLAWSERLGGEVETAGASLVVRDHGSIRVAGTQDGAGSLVDFVGVEGWTAFVADRGALGGIESTFMGVGPRRPESVSLDRNGDLVYRAISDATTPSLIIQWGAATWDDIHWIRAFHGPLASFTLPSGETIVATAEAIQMLGR